MRQWRRPELSYLQATYNRPRVKLNDDIYVPPTIPPQTALPPLIEQDGWELLRQNRLKKGQAN